MKILKKILALTLVFALGIGAGYVSEHPVTENSRFQAFTEKLFQTEVSRQCPDPPLYTGRPGRGRYPPHRNDPGRSGHRFF